MSIDDFDNNAPDNRPTERWTRLADAARQDERRKIWRACGMDGEPPKDSGQIATALRNEYMRPLTLADVFSPAVLGGVPEPAAVVAAIRTAAHVELDEVRRVLGARPEESAVQAARRILQPQFAEGSPDETSRTRAEAEELRRCIRAHGFTAAPARLRQIGFTELEILLGLDLEDLRTRALTVTEPAPLKPVEVARTSGLTLRSTDLASGIAVLSGDGAPEQTKYLIVDGEYYERVDEPEYSLVSGLELKLEGDARDALAAGDGPGYLRVLRCVLKEGGRL